MFFQYVCFYINFYKLYTDKFIYQNKQADVYYANNSYTFKLQHRLYHIISHLTCTHKSIASIWSSWCYSPAFLYYCWDWEHLFACAECTGWYIGMCQVHLFASGWVRAHPISISVPNVRTQTCNHTRDKIAVVTISLATIPDSIATPLDVYSEIWFWLY